MTRTIHATRFAVLVCACLVVGCGASQTSARHASADAWSGMDFVQRHGVMSWTVLPNMARVVQREDATTYPELTCATCHGDDARAQHYAMPGPLPALSDADIARAAHVDDDARDERSRRLRFMRDVVVPRFDHLIRGGGRTSCRSCHRRADSSGGDS